MPNEVVARDLKSHGLLIDLDELKARDWAMMPGIQIIPSPGLGDAFLAFDWAFVWRERWFARGTTGRTEQEAVGRLKMDDPIFRYVEIGLLAVRSAFQDAGIALPPGIAEAVRKAAAPKPKQLSGVEERNAYIVAEASKGVSGPAITRAIQQKWPNHPVGLSYVEKIAKRGLGGKPRKPGPKPK